MKRLERLTSLLTYLQSRRYSRVRDIEAKFGVSERTVYRDIKALEESGVPIGFEKDKGYFIVDGHFLPPLAFSLEEAKSFIFVEQLARKYTDKYTFQHFSSALEKIKNKLKDQQLEDVEMLEAKVQAYVNDDFTPKYLSIAEQACSNQNVLQILYEDFMKKKTERIIEPVGITFYSQSWHLIAFCHLRNDYRDFSLNRIKDIHMLEEEFLAPRLSLNEYIQKLENSQPS